MIESTPDARAPGPFDAMTPFVAAQVQSIIEDIRMLEVPVTAPLGLYSDIRMLRQALALPDAADLACEEEHRRRIAYRSLASNAADVALGTIQHIETSLAILEKVTDRDDSPVSPEWVAQAGRPRLLDGDCFPPRERRSRWRSRMYDGPQPIGGPAPPSPQLSSTNYVAPRAAAVPHEPPRRTKDP